MDSPLQYKPTYFDVTAMGSLRLPSTGIEPWDSEGVMVFDNLLPHDLIDAYIEERTKLLGDTDKWRPGWNGPCPFTHVKSIRDLATYRPLTERLKPLIGGDEPGLHLCLSGFQSTERKLHQDRFLNPEFVGEKYIACWLVLEDVDPDSGPFTYVPGSHRWPVIERGKVWSKMKHLGQRTDVPTWPSDCQDWLAEACEVEIQKRGAEKKEFLGKKGQVLAWHASLLHEGSKPKNPALERRALITHYSSIQVRPDMEGGLRQLENGSFVFQFPGYKEPERTTHKSA